MEQITPVTFWREYLYYLLGFGTFIITIIINLTHGKKFKFRQYLQDFLYTLLSIVIGVLVVEILELNHSFSKLIAIIMGLFGSSILSKFLLKKEIYVEQISDAAIKRVCDTLDIRNSGSKSKSPTPYKITEIPMDGLIPSKDDYFNSPADNTYGDGFSDPQSSDTSTILNPNIKSK